MLTLQDTEKWEEREVEVPPVPILCSLLQAVAATLKATPAYGWVAGWAAGQVAGWSGVRKLPRRARTLNWALKYRQNVSG